ncbi:DJ-1/PfpI family protein [Streptomyces sp. NPDC001835]|uniref:DJ-1/PfpI family protein n=1 Tax=Streptomyces sp. NPDC001835 TaxID=3154528 RepID=UPI0033337A30
MKDRPSGRKPLLVTVLVFPGVRLLDVTGPIEVFTTANEFGGRYRVRTVSPDGADVVTAAGTGLRVDLAAAQVQGASDVVVIPGGPEWPSLIKDDALLDAMRGLDARGCRTASICTGAFLLAAAGLLDGRKATTHWRFADQLALHYPKVTVEADALFVRDGHIMTSAGVTSISRSPWSRSTSAPTSPAPWPRTWSCSCSGRAASPSSVSAPTPRARDRRCCAGSWTRSPRTRPPRTPLPPWRAGQV